MAEILIFALMEQLLPVLAYVIILSFVLMVKSPKLWVWLYKGAVFIVMLIVLFVALFFYLEGNAYVSALNINLHPWRNFILYPVLVAVACVAVSFAISQLPLLFVKYHNKKRIVKYEGIVYAVVLAIGIVCLSGYCGVGELNNERLQAGNDVVRLIYKYNSAYRTQCQTLSELGLKPVDDCSYEYKGMWFLLNANDKAFELRFRSPHGSEMNYDFTYSSDAHKWNETIIW